MIKRLNMTGIPRVKPKRIRKKMRKTKTKRKTRMTMRIFRRKRKLPFAN